MSANVKITEQIRKSQLQAQEIEELKQSFVIVPYQVSGIRDYTNQGSVDSQINPEQYETFKRIWTGNDAAVIQWKNSIFYTKNTTIDENGVEHENAKMKFQLGEVFLGLLQVNSSEVRVQQDVSLTDYTAQDLKQTYTFFVSAKSFTITDYHQLMLYKLPEIAGSTLFRISSVEKDFVGRQLMSYVITFESINQDFANTGSARQQNIMPSAIGQGYLECKVEDETWPERLGDKFNELKDGVDYYSFYGRYITADYSKTQNRPAKKIVVRQLGLGILSSVACVGRPVQAGEAFNLYKQPRLLFPINFTNPSTSNLFHTQQETTNYYFGEFAPTLNKWKEWKEMIKETYQAGVSKWEYEGLLEYDKKALQATNQQVGNGYEYDLYGKLVKDATTVKRVPWTFETTKKTIDTSMVLGCDTQYYIGDRKEIHNHMFDNYWTQKYMKVLPLTTKSNATMGLWSDILFGGLGGGIWDVVKNLSIWFIGTASKWIGRTNPLRYQCYRGIINADFLDIAEQYWTSNNYALPLDIFKANGMNDNPASLFFNNNTINTSFEANLTNKFLARNGKVLDTLNIGQNKDEAGQYLQDNQLPYYLNGQERLVDSGADGFIIDEIQINSIYNGEYSIEFLDADNKVIWSSIFQSAGMWANSTRDTWTLRNTSVYNRENVFFDKPFNYPEKLDEPLLAIPLLEKIPVSASFAYSNVVNNSNELKYLEGKYWNPKLPNTLNTYRNEVFQGFGGGLLEKSWIEITYLLPTNTLKESEVEVFKYTDAIKNYKDFFTYYNKMNFTFSATYNINNCLYRSLYQFDSGKTINENGKQIFMNTKTIDLTNNLLENDYFVETIDFERQVLKSFKYRFVNKENGLFIQIKEFIVNPQAEKVIRIKEISSSVAIVPKPKENVGLVGVYPDGGYNTLWNINLEFIPKI